LGEGWRLIVPDLRGLGRSEASTEADMGTYADDLLAVLRAADEDRPVVLVGMSMGGYVCMEFCRRYPQRVRALALVDTRVEPDSPEGAEGRLRTAERVVEEGSVLVADDMVQKLFATGAPAELREQWHAAMAASSPRGIATALRAMAGREDSRPLMSELRVPALVLVGTDDEITPPDGARRMAQLAGAPLELVPGAGHMAAAEKPAAVAQALRRFLDGLPHDTTPSPRSA
jgi:pimeloyl-ACP methyl ester carboxylesterase